MKTPFHVVLGLNRVDIYLSHYFKIFSMYPPLFHWHLALITIISSKWNGFDFHIWNFISLPSSKRKNLLTSGFLFMPGNLQIVNIAALCFLICMRLLYKIQIPMPNQNYFLFSDSCIWLMNMNDDCFLSHSVLCSLLLRLDFSVLRFLSKSWARGVTWLGTHLIGWSDQNIKSSQSYSSADSWLFSCSALISQYSCLFAVWTFVEIKFPKFQPKSANNSTFLKS